MSGENAGQLWDLCRLDFARDPSSPRITNPKSGTCKIPAASGDLPGCPDLTLAGLLVWRSRTTGHVGATRISRCVSLLG
jgi:hypothetical protein